MSLIVVSNPKNTVKFNSSEDIILHNYNSKHLRVFFANVKPTVKEFKHIYIFYFNLNHRFIKVNDFTDKISVVFKSDKKSFHFESHCIPVRMDKNGKLFLSLRLKKIEPEETESKSNKLKEVKELFGEKTKKVLIKEEEECII